VGIGPTEEGVWHGKSEPNRCWDNPLPSNNLEESWAGDDKRAWNALDDAILSLLVGARPDVFRRVEGRLLHLAFLGHRQNQVRTAAALGLSRNVLRALLRRHGILK